MSMNQPLWRWSAVDLARAIARKEFSAREATSSVLSRIAQVNPVINALPEVLADQALAAADEADRRLARGEVPGPLHGVPVSTKVNVDQAGCATTGGIEKLAGNVATEDSPVVANLRQSGAIIVGRSNTPAFSLRWFTDNALHGRTLNPWDHGVTPGGSSGGAAAALASGMGAIAHGNDYGGSIRYPAFACGVVGLRPTVGRVPAYNATASDERGISSQLMSVQGPLTRTVADARLALQVMARGDARDPIWTPAPLDYPRSSAPIKVALFRGLDGIQADPDVVAAVGQAGRWLEDAGFVVEEIAPPHFHEACEMWRQLVWDDLRRAEALIGSLGDAPLRSNMKFFLAYTPPLDRDGYLGLLARRLAVARAWSVFLERFPVLLMPVSWMPPAPVDEDLQTLERLRALTDAQGPLLSTALLGLPGLSVPTGLVNGIPTGVQLVSNRFREDLCLLAGEVIEKSAGVRTIAGLA